MIPALFVFLKAKTVTIVTIKIGAGLLSLAYLMSDDEKLFAAVSQQIFFLFLQISLLTKCAYPFRAIPLLPTVGRSGASIALWHPPALCGQQPLHTSGRTRTPYSISERRKLMARKQTERVR